MNKTQKAALEKALQSGFTFAGDSCFATFRSAKAALTALVRSGHLVAEENEFGTQYVPTAQAREEAEMAKYIAKLLGA